MIMKNVIAINAPKLRKTERFIEKSKTPPPQPKIPHYLLSINTNINVIAE